MKRNELTREYIMDWWLKKYHNTTCAEVVKKHPRLCKTPKWYKLYLVTQEQHDEWYSWVIDTICKTYGFSKDFAKRNFAFDYLNCSPDIKDE